MPFGHDLAIFPANKEGFLTILSRTTLAPTEVLKLRLGIPKDRTGNIIINMDLYRKDHPTQPEHPGNVPVNKEWVDDVEFREWTHEDGW